MMELSSPSLSGLSLSPVSSACPWCSSPLLLSPNGKIVLDCEHEFCPECVSSPCPGCQEEEQLKQMETLLQEEKKHYIGLIRATTKIRDEFLGGLHQLPFAHVAELKDERKRLKTKALSSTEVQKSLKLVQQKKEVGPITDPFNNTKCISSLF